ncbi:hypothetical protein [Oryzicola mucosus]|uniref:Uncharacterized protein n=1 Tax=Oryzicola mucosus TaxID=2767425 RepID=A0A8J6PV79_9HYPH|nr:hypothetical protein [Oryzicola mucosus]MBD0416489.1 hypothetical protein [Oryzicola mucosus]
MRVLYKGLGVVFIALAWLGSVSLALLISDRVPPLTYEGARALQSSVPQGGAIDVEFEVYRTKICPSTVRRYLVDADDVQHAITNYTVGSNSKKGREVYQRTITVPQNAAVGPAIYFVRLEYICNLAQQLGWPIKVESPPVPFRVTAAVSMVPFGLPPPGEGD